MFFRGHSDASWKLMPAFGRCKLTHRKLTEQRLYFDFVVKAGALLPPDASGWNTLFAMQHHGLPTRLLDWTETFAVALYFALKEAVGDATVWILNPGLLNEQSIGHSAILSETELRGSYIDHYGGTPKKLAGEVIAVSPNRHNPRVAQQVSAFTLHDNLTQPLEQLHPSVVSKIVLPAGSHAEGRRFLALAGISEFTLFPDLDGLSRELRMAHIGII